VGLQLREHRGIGTVGSQIVFGPEGAGEQSEDPAPFVPDSTGDRALCRDDDDRQQHEIEHTDADEQQHRGWIEHPGRDDDRDEHER